MKYEFGYLPSPGEELKALSKKYKSLKKDFKALKGKIGNNPEMGISLGEGIRKIRLNIISKNEGERGRARVITYEILVKIDNEETTSVAFVSIYGKSEYNTIDLDIVRKVIEEYRRET